jgi:hypothetical protein
MRVLFFGTLEWGSTSLQRARALGTLADDIHLLDNRIALEEYINRGRIDRLKVRASWPPLAKSAGDLLLREAKRYRPDCVWVDQGIIVAASAVEGLRDALPGCRLVHYTPDSILSPGLRRSPFRGALPAYDLCITTKERELDDYAALGARRVAFSWQGYDHTIHKSVELSEEERDLYTSDLVFVGQHMPKRAEYLAAIVSSTDLRLNLFGRGWKGGSTGKILGAYDRGWLYGEDYAKAISGARIALCFLNDAVKDDYTTRTFEIPACGSMMLGERTTAHLELFEEGTEAAYFSSVDECLEKIDFYLNNEDERRAVAAGGRDRVAASPYSWRDRMSECVEQIEALA